MSNFSARQDERQRWPMAWADEVMPPGRSAPDGFIIVQRETGKPASYVLGYLPNTAGLSAAEWQTLQLAVAPGDIVPFICCDTLGDVEITVNADGSFEAHDLIDPRATHFDTVGDVDSLAGSVAEFARQYAETWRGAEPAQPFPHRVEVRTSYWSEAIPFKLIAVADGVAFEQVTAQEARQ